MAPIDHTFRYYQPEQSYYEVLIPPIIQFNQPDLTVVTSDPEAKVEVVPSTNILRIKGRTEEALMRRAMTIFIFGNQYRTRLINTIRVEVHARQVIFSRTRIGEKCQHAIQMPSAAFGSR